MIDFVIPLAGVRIVESKYLVELKQFRFPRSKKVRIRRKWEKNPANYKAFPMNKVFQMTDGTIICHPVIAEKIRKYTEAGNDRLPR